MPAEIPLWLFSSSHWDSTHARVNYSLVALEKAIICAKNFRWMRNKSCGMSCWLNTAESWMDFLFLSRPSSHRAYNYGGHRSRNRGGLSCRDVQVTWKHDDVFIFKKKNISLDIKWGPTHEYRGEISCPLLLRSPSWDPILWMEE